MKHPLIRPQIHFPVIGNVTCFVTTGLRKCNSCRYSTVLAQASPVGNELSCRLVFPSSRYDHITPLHHELHWLKAAERTDYKLALLVYKCRQGAAPSYLTDELREPADFEARCRLDYVPTSHP